MGARSAVDLFALAGGDDGAGAEERDREEADDVELPAVGLGSKVVSEGAARGRVAEAGPPGYDREHLVERAGVGDEDGRTVLVAEEAEVGEHGWEAAEALR